MSNNGYEGWYDNSWDDDYDADDEWFDYEDYRDEHGRYLDEVDSDFTNYQIGLMYEEELVDL